MFSLDNSEPNYHFTGHCHTEQAELDYHFAPISVTYAEDNSTSKHLVTLVES